MAVPPHHVLNAAPAQGEDQGRVAEILKTGLAAAVAGVDTRAAAELALEPALRAVEGQPPDPVPRSLTARRASAAPALALGPDAALCPALAAMMAVAGPNPEPQQTPGNRDRAPVSDPMRPAAGRATVAVPGTAFGPALGPAPMPVAETVLDHYSRAVAATALDPASRAVACLCPEARGVACFEMR